MPPRINPTSPSVNNNGRYIPNANMDGQVAEALAYKLGINMTTKLQELEASANGAVIQSTIKAAETEINSYA